MGLDNNCAILCSCPSHHIGNNKHYNNMQWGHVSDITWHISLFPFHLIHIVWLHSTPPSHEKATHQRQIQQILCEIEQLCSTQQCPGCNSQYRLYSLCMYVNVIVTYGIQKKQQREMIFIWLELWEPSPSSILSSLPSPPFLLTCAVRGDINLNDRLCDPPSRLGGRRSAVNINILPGFAADTEQPWPPWIFICYHRQKHMSPSARLKSMPSPASAALFPSPLQTNKTVCLLLGLDCLLIFIATQADGLTCHPLDLHVDTKTSAY